MARWRSSVTFTPLSAAWLSKFGLVVSFAARNQKIRALATHWYQQPQKLFGEDSFSNRIEWCGRMLEKRSLWHLYLRCKGKSGHSVLLSNQSNPVRVNFRTLTLKSQPESCWTDLQRSSLKLGDEIQRLCEEGKLDKALHFLLSKDEQGIIPSAQVYRSLLKLSTRRKALAQAKEVHAHLAKYGLESTKFLGESVVNTLVKCGGLEDALQVFERLPRRTVVSWTAVISGYTAAGQGEEALRMYEIMRQEGLEPDKYTFVSVLKACGSIFDLELGKRIHAEAVKYELAYDLLVATGLIDMYSKCQRIVDAKKVFDGLPKRDVVSWTAMLSAYLQQGEAGEALHLYGQMQLEAFCLDPWTFVGGLQACGMLAEKEEHVTKLKYLEMGKEIHAKAWGMGYKSDLFIGNALISMYGKCGSIVDAKDVFDGLPQRDGVSWNAMLVAYSQQGLPDEALQLYDQMLVEGITLGARTFVGALQACGMLADREGDGVGVHLIKVRALEQGRTVHTNAWKNGYKSDVFISNTLISMYGKCGSLVDARKVFDALHQRTLVSWNAMLAAHAQQGEAEKALQLYNEMVGGGMSPDDRTLVSLLQACGMLADEEDVVGNPSSKSMALNMGKDIHRIAQRKGYESDVFVANTLISMYGKCGSTVDAIKVFNRLARRTLVSWNAMLTAHVQKEQPEIVLQLYEQMVEEDIDPDGITFVSALQAVAMLAEEKYLEGQMVNPTSLQKGRVIHSYACRKSCLSDSLTSSTVISMYGKCGSIVDAQNAFNGLSERNLVSWNAMLAAHVQQGEAAKALQLYEQLLKEGWHPDDRTFVSVLQACGLLAEKEECGLWDEHAGRVQFLEKGKKIHAEAVTRGYRSHLFVGSTLVSMYAKCGSITDSQIVFAGLPLQDAVAWNAMLMAYCQHEQPEKVLQFYEQMLRSGVTPDDRTFVTALQACGMLADEEDDGAVDGGLAKVRTLVRSRALHSDAWSKGLGSDVFISNMLITVYGKCGSSAEAQIVFDCLSQQNVVSWTVLLSAYVQQGQGDKAVRLYQQMQEDGVCPNEITHMCILQACSSTGHVDICRQIHHTLVSTRKDMGPLLGNTLIHAYGKCATMVDAQKVFDDLPQRNVVSWNTLIAGYAREGDFAASLRCYEQMLSTGMKPNAVTFCSLLSACSHAGLVDIGVEYFESMSRDYHITPEIWHYVSMVDLLGRAGFFARVEQLLSMLPVQPNLALWLCLLGACRKHGKVALGKRAFDCAVHLQPQHAAAYVIMSNIFVHAGLWDSALEVKELGQKVGAWKKPGQSWIGHQQEVHTFVAGDSKHEQHEQLYHLLGQVTPDLQYSLQATC